MVPSITNKINAVATIILSAKGSSNSPNLDSSLYILANNPSKKSVNEAKTFLQMAAISVLLTGETGNKILNFQDYNAQTIGIILLWLSAFLTLYTGYEYLRKGIDHAISEDEKNYISFLLLFPQHLQLI